MYKALIEKRLGELQLIKVDEVLIKETKEKYKYNYIQRSASRKVYKKVKEILKDLDNNYEDGFYISQVLTDHILYQLEFKCGNDRKESIKIFNNPKLNDQFSYIQAHKKEADFLIKQNSEMEFGHTLYDSITGNIKNTNGKEVDFMKFHDALIGKEVNKGKDVYDYEKCLKILENDGMNREDAIEYMSKIISLYFGDLTPLFIKINKINIEDFNKKYEYILNSDDSDKYDKALNYVLDNIDTIINGK